MIRNIVIETILTETRYLSLNERIDATLHLEIDIKTFAKYIDNYTKQFSEFRMTFLELQQIILELWYIRLKRIEFLNKI